MQKHDEARIMELVMSRVDERLQTCKQELHAEMLSVAHKLREDDAFMRPAAQKFTDHAGDHLFDKVARRFLLLIVGIFGAAAFGLAMWLGGRGFK